MIAAKQSTPRGATLKTEKLANRFVSPHTLTKKESHGESQTATVKKEGADGQDLTALPQ